MGKVNQFLTGVAASFAALGMGSLNVWPSYTVQEYTSANTTALSTPMSELQVSLLGSLPSLGAMAGTLVAGVLINYLGRKIGAILLVMPYIVSLLGSLPSLGAMAGTLVAGVLINYLGRKIGAILLVMPYIIHWTIIMLTSSPAVIIAARFIGGVAGGAYIVYASIFVAEICEPSIRGALASGPMTFYGLGTLVSYLNGWFLSYEVIIWVNLALCLLNLILLTAAVETPMFLLRQNREQAALKALAHYRSGSASSSSVQEDLDAIKQQLYAGLNECKTSEQTYTSSKKKSTWKLLFTTPYSRKAFILVWIMLTLQPSMGGLVLQVYAGPMFQQAAPGLSAHLCSVLVSLVSFAGSITSTVLADRAGRRVLIISSSGLCALCMTSLAALQAGAAPAWVNALIILVFYFGYYYGAVNAPFVLLAEVFSPEVQSIASVLLVEWLLFMNFVNIGAYPWLAAALGVRGACAVFAGICAACALFAARYLPETKGLTNKQIQELFDR